MSNSAEPDSWESQADSPTKTTSSDVATAKFSTLNVNAVEFVPSFAKSGVERAEDEEVEMGEAEEERPVLNGASSVFDVCDVVVAGDACRLGAIVFCLNKIAGDSKRARPALCYCCSVIVEIPLEETP